MENKMSHKEMAELLKHSILEDIQSIAGEQDKIDFLNDLKSYLHEISPLAGQPVDNVEWVSVDRVEANNYNPNSVANKEMQLLHTSIKHDGYTQPVVTIFDKKADKYIIIDGFHRYFTCKNSPEIKAANKGRLPVVVLNKDINERMAATVRHNRARGSHSVNGMSNMVFKMLDNGWSDEDICNHLGMGADELLRLKHITGFSKLFENAEYNKAWVTKKQIQIQSKYKKEMKKSDRE